MVKSLVNLILSVFCVDMICGCLVTSLKNARLFSCTRNTDVTALVELDAGAKHGNIFAVLAALALIHALI